MITKSLYATLSIAIAPMAIVTTTTTTTTTRKGCTTSYRQLG
jgi:hypothetical protein